MQGNSFSPLPPSFSSSLEPVWKVARYTSAAPVYFKEIDDYVDGGVLANNPSETGLTAIQNYHHSKGSRLPIALVVNYIHKAHSLIGTFSVVIHTLAYSYLRFTDSKACQSYFELLYLYVHTSMQ